MSEVHLEELLAAAVFTGARVSGLMVFCPFLGSEAVPVPVKAGLALLLTVVLHPLHGPAGLALGSWQWAQVALGEAAIGLVLGLVANFLFESALMAGQILGVQIGYSLANVFFCNWMFTTGCCGRWCGVSFICLRERRRQRLRPRPVCCMPREEFSWWECRLRRRRWWPRW
jgi:flagellar biosynthesis protein FliR